MSAPSRRSTLALTGGVALVLVAALLTRGTTAVDAEQLEAARPAPPATSASAPVPAGPLPPGRTVIRPDGVDGLRLGMTAAELAQAGYSVQRSRYGSCRRVLPGPADTGPGDGAVGWLVEDRLGSVTVDSGAGAASSFLGAGLGDPLADLPDGEAVRRSSSTVAVPWQPEPVTVDVVRVSLGADVTVSFVDRDDDDVIDHVQVLDDDAAGCGSLARAMRDDAVAALAPLGLQGRGELRVGTPLARAAELVSLEGDHSASQPAPPCRLVLADDEPGLRYLVVALDGTGTEVVRAVTVDAGRTEAGLRVGSTPEEVGTAYPGITASYLGARWDQGLSAGWQLADGELRLWPGREEVHLADVDAVLVGPRDVVGQIQVGPGC